METRTLNYFKHETAVVDDGAHVGEGTKIWHFCHVSSGARIGAGCVLGQDDANIIASIFNGKIIDLRHIKDRSDDIVVVFKKV